MQVKTKNLLLGGIVGALVLLLWYTQLYSKMESQASKQKAAAKSASSQAAQLQHQLDGQTSANKKNGNGPSEKELLEAVPNDPQEAAFLRSVEDIRISSGAAWDSVAPAQTTPGAAISSNSVTIKVGGTEDQIARYITGLSALKRVFVLDNVTINGGTGTAAGAPAVSGRAGATFVGDLFTASLTGRIFSEPGAITATPAVGGSGTTPVTGAPAPTGAGAGGSAPAVQNNG